MMVIINMLSNRGLQIYLSFKKYIQIMSYMYTPPSSVSDTLFSLMLSFIKKEPFPNIPDTKAKDLRF